MGNIPIAYFSGDLGDALFGEYQQILREFQLDMADVLGGRHLKVLHKKLPQVGRGVITLSAKIFNADIPGKTVLIKVTDHRLQPMILGRVLLLTADADVIQDLEEQRQNLQRIPNLLLHPAVVQLMEQTNGNGGGVQISVQRQGKVRALVCRGGKRKTDQMQMGGFRACILVDLAGLRLQKTEIAGVQCQCIAVRADLNTAV